MSPDPPLYLMEVEPISPLFPQTTDYAFSEAGPPTTPELPSSDCGAGPRTIPNVRREASTVPQDRSLLQLQLRVLL